MGKKLDFSAIQKDQFLSLKVKYLFQILSGWSFTTFLPYSVLLSKKHISHIWSRHVVAVSGCCSKHLRGRGRWQVCVRCTLVTTVRIAPVVEQLFLYCMCMCNLALFSTLNFLERETALILTHHCTVLVVATAGRNYTDNRPDEECVAPSRDTVPPLMI